MESTRAVPWTGEREEQVDHMLDLETESLLQLETLSCLITTLHSGNMPGTYRHVDNVDMMFKVPFESIK